MIENIGFIIGRIWRFCNRTPQRWIALSILCFFVFCYVYRLIKINVDPPDSCGCALNVLKIDTFEYDSVFQSMCESYSNGLSKELKEKRAIEAFNCPEVKSEIYEIQQESQKRQTESIKLKNCNSASARDFVKKRFMNIGATLLDGPVLVQSDNKECYYVFTMIVQKKFEVVNCEMAVKFEGESFAVKQINCQ